MAMPPPAGPNGPPQQQQPQGAPAPGAPNGIAPNAPPPNPMEQLLAQPQPQGEGSSLLTLLLGFLAGNGTPNVMKLLQMLRGGPGGGKGARGGNPMASHKPQGVSVAGSPNPGVNVTPSAAGGMPPGGAPNQGSPIPPQLLALLAKMQGQGGQPQ